MKTNLELCEVLSSHADDIVGLFSKDCDDKILHQLLEPLRDRNVWSWISHFESISEHKNFLNRRLNAFPGKNISRERCFSLFSRKVLLTRIKNDELSDKDGHSDGHKGWNRCTMDLVSSGQVLR